MNHDEMIFKVSEAPEGGYDARALSHGIFTRGEDWDNLEGADERKPQDRHAGHGGQPTRCDRTRPTASWVLAP